MTIVLQESAVAYAFVNEALPLLERAGIDLEVYYVASAELFDLLPDAERARIFPEAKARRRWASPASPCHDVPLDPLRRGPAASLHPFARGTTPAGPGRAVIAEAGLDGESQFRRISEYVSSRPRG